MPVKFATVSELIDYDASTAIVAWLRSTHRFTETTGRLTTNVWSICDLTKVQILSSIRAHLCDTAVIACRHAATPDYYGGVTITFK